jgi:serine/threonine protein kinase
MGESQTIHGHDPLLGSMIGGRYRVKDLLGEGGMGQVYLAIHEAIEKPVALKILRPEYSRKADIVTRFQQEAISASRIKHPNVLDVFDFGQTMGGCFFLAMEFLEGHDLSDELERRGRLESPRAISITLQIAKALAAAHGAGVVHRDLKPENVFLQKTADDEEVVKIVDFGIAQLRTNEEAAAASQKRQRRRLTRTGMIFGTPEYMAPEQAAGKHADLRVDVYALGVMMYEMFTGAVPFTGDTFMAVLSSHLHDPVPPLRQVCPELAISTELEALIGRALAKQPDHRFASMQELAGALRATPEGEGRRPSVLPTATAGLQIGSPLAVDRGFDAASAQTLVPDEARHVASAERPETAGPIEIPKRSLLPLLLGVGALLVAGTAGAIFWWGGARSIQTPVAPQPPPTPTSVTPEPSTVTRVETPPAPSASAATTVEPASGVRLEVETTPPGAEVFLDGAQVCDSSPCEVRADHNETVILTAKKGALTGTKKVLAQREQRVVIQLKPPPGPLPRPTAKPPVSDKLCTKYDEQLEMYVSVPCPK